MPPPLRGCAAPAWAVPPSPVAVPAPAACTAAPTLSHDVEEYDPWDDFETPDKLYVPPPLDSDEEILEQQLQEAITLYDNDRSEPMTAPHQPSIVVSKSCPENSCAQ